MNIKISIVLVLLVSNPLMCQFDIRTINKEQLNIYAPKTVRGGYLVLPIIVDTEFLEQSKDYHSFLEKHDKVFYFFNNELLIDVSDINSRDFSERQADEDEIKLMVRDSLRYKLNKFMFMNSNLKFYQDYFIDSKNRIWLFPCDSTIFYIENDTLKNISVTGSKSNFRVRHITQSNDGIMWFASRHGLYRYDDHTLKVEKIDIPGKKRLKVLKVAPLSTQGIIFMYNKVFIGIFNDQGFKELLWDQNIHDLVCDRNKNVWITTDSRLILVKTEDDFLTINGMGSYTGKLTGSFTDSRNNIWFLTKNTIGRISNNKPNIRLGPYVCREFNTYFEFHDKIWFIGEAGTIIYDYKTETFEDINAKYDPKLEDNGTAFSIVFNFGISGLSNVRDDKMIYYQYYIITNKFNLPGVMRIEETEERSILLMYNNKSVVDLKYILKGRDYRSLDVFIDSKENIWIDTPTQIHKVSLKR